MHPKFETVNLACMDNKIPKLVCDFQKALSLRSMNIFPMRRGVEELYGALFWHIRNARLHEGQLHCLHL